MHRFGSLSSLGERSLQKLLLVHYLYLVESNFQAKLLLCLTPEGQPTFAKLELGGQVRSQAGRAVAQIGLGRGFVNFQNHVEACKIFVNFW